MGAPSVGPSDPVLQPVTISDYNAVQNALKTQQDTTSVSDAVIAFKLAGLDATNPRLALSEYLSLVTDPALVAKLQNILDSFGSSDASRSFLTNFIKAFVDYSPLSQAGGTYDTALNTLYASDGFQNKTNILQDAIANYNQFPDPLYSALDTYSILVTKNNLDKAIADYNALPIQDTADALQNAQIGYNNAVDQYNRSTAYANYSMFLVNHGADILNQAPSYNFNINNGPPADNIPPYTFPGPYDLKSLRASDVNTAAASWNAALNSSGATNTAALNAIRASYGLPPLPIPTTYPTNLNSPNSAPGLNYTLPTLSDMVAIVNTLIETRVNIAQTISNTRSNASKDDPNDDKTYRPSKVKAEPGSLGTSAIANVNIGEKTTAINSNEAEAARKILEAFFNVTGVPIGSLLIDQLATSITPLLFSVQLAAGLTSAGAGEIILRNGHIAQEGGSRAAFIAAALGNFKKTGELVKDPIFLQNIKQILLQTSEFQALPIDQQNALVNGLANAFGTYLLASSFQQVADALGAPGLTSQLVDPNAPSAGSAVDDANAAPAPSAPLEVPPQETASAPSPPSQGSSSLAAPTQGQTETVTLQNDQEVLSVIQQEVMRDIIIREIEREELSPFNPIVGEIPTTRNELKNYLENIGINSPEAALIAARALAESYIYSVAANPLAVVQPDLRLPKEELSKAFKDLVVHHLSGFLPPKRPEFIATEYEIEMEILRVRLGQPLGLPIVKDIIEKNELRRHTDYESRKEELKFPQKVEWSPLNLGYTLLLLGHGVTSAEKGLAVGRYSGVAPTNTLSG